MEGLRGFAIRLLTHFAHLLLEAVCPKCFHWFVKKHFESSKSMAQTGNEQQYNIDCAKDTYEYNGCVNNTNVAWITYRL